MFFLKKDPKGSLKGKGVFLYSFITIVILLGLFSVFASLSNFSTWAVVFFGFLMLLVLFPVLAVVDLIITANKGKQEDVDGQSKNVFFRTLPFGVSLCIKLGTVLIFASLWFIL